MKNHKPGQLELFTDGARAVAAAKRPPRPRPSKPISRLASTLLARGCMRS
jgi:hypothetical protein